ncbi:hypothetical protein QZH41_010551 [Actinostola sp. cb2023]|nr:hypothetical protein QZH41_010551 [Actinostola sp. cb2023]
MIGPFHSHVS